MEEERRLCYVGITRAMRQLTFTFAETRRLHGTDSYNRPSRFIAEIPTQLLQEIRMRGAVARPYDRVAAAQYGGGSESSTVKRFRRTTARCASANVCRTASSAKVSCCRRKDTANGRACR